MILRIIFLSFLLALLQPVLLFAQEGGSEQAIEQLIEEIAESTDAELDYTQLAEDLYYFADNPLNLNEANRADLERIQFLNDYQIEDILAYRRNHGEMLSIYELGRLKSFNAVDIRRIIPFVSVEAPEEEQALKVRNAVRYGRHTLFMRTQFYVQKEKGYTEPENPGDTRYLGDRMKYYTRYQYNYKRKILFGFVGEKDEGEEFFTGTQKQGFDHIAAHFELRDIGRIKSLSLGDYTVRLGQGLALGTGLYSGKSPYVLDLKKSVTGVRKYSSTGENEYFRGLGGTVDLGDFDLTGFVSYKKIDGSIDQTDTLTNEIDVISAFQNTGYHRTMSQMNNRKTVSEFVFGGSLKWHSDFVKIAANYLQYQYGADLNRRYSLNRQYEFQGDFGANLSLDYEANYKNFYFYGEIAGSHNQSYAVLNGALARIAPGFGIAALHRYYARDYQAQYAGGFAEQSSVQNEEGLYFGVEAHPIRNWKVGAYFDMYSFPWLGYRRDGPARGEDYFAQVDFSPNRDLEMYWRFKHETKLENSSENTVGVDPLLPSALTKIRYDLSYPVSSSIELENRVEYAHYTKGDERHENGFMLYQDVAWKPKTFPLVAHFRLAYFDAGYYARLYAYENDILYAFSIPAYSGQGFRSYITLKYTLVDDFLDLWLRYAHTHYTDRETVGSGLTEVQGPDKSQVKIQLRMKF